MFELWLVPGTNGHRVDGRAKDILAVLCISDPAGLRGVEDCVPPRLDIERKPLCVDVGGGSPEAPVATLAQIDVVEEYDDFGWGHERAVKVDTHRGGGIGVSEEIAHVFTSGEL